MKVEIKFKEIDKYFDELTYTGTDLRIAESLVKLMKDNEVKDE